MHALLTFLLLLAPQDALPGPLRVRNLGVRYRDGTRVGHLTLDGRFLAMSEARGSSITRKFVYEKRRGLRQIAASTLQNQDFSHLQRGSLVVTTGSESVLGDLNGDGDALDLCAIAMDLARGATMPPRAIAAVNTGTFILGADLVGTRFSESVDGISLNGDSDLNDIVALGWRPSTASFLAPAFSVQFMFPLDGAWAFEASEPGERHDYTHDGDRTDLVYGVQDLASATVTILPLAIDVSRRIDYVDGRVFAFSASEAGTGIDLDGDGMLTKSILHAYSLDREELVNLQAEAGIFDHFVTGHSVAFNRKEARFGDLNGDGDALDTVAQVYDGETFGAGATPGFLLDLDTNLISGEGRWIQLLVSEARVGDDLNGDGDLFDLVLHLYDRETGELTNTGRTFDEGGVFRGHFGLWLAAENGLMDLNGDGDHHGVRAPARMPEARSVSPLATAAGAGQRVVMLLHERTDTVSACRSA